MNKKEKIKIICKHCEKNVFLRPGRAKVQQFCSHKCALIFNGKQRRTGIIKECLICKTEIYVGRFDKIKKFCSRECVNKSGLSINTGRTRFKKRQIPWNKGLKGVYGTSMKGKTYEEMHGDKKAKELKEVIALRFHKENHPCWKDGISYEDYDINFDFKLKHKIKKRDKYRCQICNNNPTNIDLHVHHIDYNKKNSNKNNLITLCNSCHPKTNKNREYWEWQLKIFMNLHHNAQHIINWERETKGGKN